MKNIDFTIVMIIYYWLLLVVIGCWVVVRLLGC